MFESLLFKLLSYFKPTSYGSKLEEYIVSKNPQSTADVETYARQYDQQQARSLV